MFEKAVIYATNAHNGQTRKGTNLPFIIHPMEVAAIVAAMTLDQDMLCAAVLHDVVEDCDGISIEDIRREFGNVVASYVYQESEDKSKTWVERKGHTIDFLKNRASRNAKIIALGDKLANIRALYRDYNILGEKLWERFNMKDKKMQGWYYRGMIEGFSEHPSPYFFKFKGCLRISCQLHISTFIFVNARSTVTGSLIFPQQHNLELLGKELMLQ